MASFITLYISRDVYAWFTIILWATLIYQINKPQAKIREMLLVKLDAINFSPTSIWTTRILVISSKLDILAGKYCSIEALFFANYPKSIVNHWIKGKAFNWCSFLTNPKAEETDRRRMY